MTFHYNPARNSVFDGGAWLALRTTAQALLGKNESLSM